MGSGRLEERSVQRRWLLLPTTEALETLVLFGGTLKECDCGRSELLLEHLEDKWAKGWSRCAHSKDVATAVDFVAPGRWLAVD